MVCETKGLSKQASKPRLSKRWTSSSAVEQSWNRLLQHFWPTGKETASRQRPTGHRLHPAPSSIMAAPTLKDFTPPPEAHDRSNVETGERRDMFTLIFSTVCSVEKLSVHSCHSKCSSESGPRVLRCSKPRT